MLVTNLDALSGLLRKAKCNQNKKDALNALVSNFETFLEQLVSHNPSAAGAIGSTARSSLPKNAPQALETGEAWLNLCKAESRDSPEGVRHSFDDTDIELLGLMNEMKGVDASSASKFKLPVPGDVASAKFSKLQKYVLGAALLELVGSILKIVSQASGRRAAFDPS